MARHRLVKALDLDDELDDYDGGYSYEEDTQMQESTARARALLGPGFTDRQIQDSLWHYYYDVEKTVNYLLDQQVRAQEKKTKPVAKKSKEPSLSTEIRSHPSVLCSSPLSARQFFADCPWFDIPGHRKAEILVEPLFPHGGLLGGASQGPPKTSKLAALAAARRKQENERSSKESAKSSISSVTLLDKLSTKSKPESSGHSKEKIQESRANLSSASARKFTGKKRSPSPEMPKAKETVLPGSSDSSVQKNDLMVPVIASPSLFAQTMVGSASNTLASPVLNTTYNAFEFLFDIDTPKPDPFAGPSPDDIVANAQSGSKGLGASKPPKNHQEASNELKKVTNDMSKATIVEESRLKKKNINVVEEYNKSKRKKTANFVVIGHVDAGKSTLMGRLLYDLKVVDQRTVDKYRREAEKIGKSSFALAWVLDAGSDERQHGVTIDIATNKFETDSTAFTILDAPGHRDFIPNMIAGAAQADFAVLVIDASIGSFESGLKGQTREHALLVRSMGVQCLVIAVNKLDAVDWAKTRFDEISQQVSAFLTAAGFQSKNLSFIPCSGLTGDNITTRSTTCSWYTGPILLEQLENSEPITQARALEGPFRLPISEVFNSGVQQPLSIAGRISSGCVQVGDKVMVIPGNESAYIKSLEVNDEPVDWAAAGQNTTLHLTDIDLTQVTIRGGDIVCSYDAPVASRTTFTLKILAFEHVMPTFCNIVVGRLDRSGRISKLIALIDKSTGKAAVGKKRPRIVKPGEAARVEIEIEGGVPVEEGTRVVLRAEGDTIATGLVESFS